MAGQTHLGMRLWQKGLWVANCIRCLTEVNEHMYTADIKVHFIQVICANDHLQPYSEECTVDFPVIMNLNQSVASYETLNVKMRIKYFIEKLCCGCHMHHCMER